MSMLLTVIFAFVGIIIFIMFIFLKKSIIKINQLSKSYFVDKLQAYDKLINEKESKLKGLNEEIAIVEKEKEQEVIAVENSESVYLYDIKTLEYQDEKIFEKMKVIDDKFAIDSGKLLTSFIEAYFNEETIQYYKLLVALREKIDDQKLYQLISKRSNIQEDEVKKYVTVECEKLLKNFKRKNKKFHILKFVSYLEKIILEQDPYIYVYVGKKEEDYSSIHPYIKMKVDEKIYKGISIVYRSRLYDYSLK